MNTYEFFQTGGYDETLAAARSRWEAENAGRRVISVDFMYAYPGNREGRWVGLRVVHEAAAP